MNKRQDIIVASAAEFTILSNTSSAGWEKDLRANRSRNSKKSGKKMKFPRRNSLNFPLRPPILASRKETPVPEDDDPFVDLVKQKSNSSKSAFPISREIKKALTILNANSKNDNCDNHSLSATSNMSTSTASTAEDDEVLKVNEFNKGASSISTPVPQRKQVLQIPTAKRKQMALLMKADESPVSVAESLDLSPLSISERRKKTKPKKASLSKLRDSSEKSSSRKRDSSEKPSSKLKDSSEKSSSKVRDSSEKLRRKTSKKNRKSSRKKVHFKQTCTMRRTLSRKDMTPKEIRRAWLCSEEYHRMQLRDEILADRVDAGRCKHGTCIRGLESKIEESAVKKLNLRMIGFEEVLVEQERQWDEAGNSINFYYDFASFAYVYGSVSEEALIAAQETAAQDRREAEKILASPLSFKAKGAGGFLKRSRFTRRRSWA
jgi:hypothetical protein